MYYRRSLCNHDAGHDIAQRTSVVHLPPPFQQPVLTIRVANSRLTALQTRCVVRLQCSVLAHSSPMSVFFWVLPFAVQRHASGSCTRFRPTNCQTRSARIRHTCQMNAISVYTGEILVTYKQTVGPFRQPVASVQRRYRSAAVANCAAARSRRSGGASTSTSGPCLRMSIISSGSWL